MKPLENSYVCKTVPKLKSTPELNTARDKKRIFPRILQGYQAQNHIYQALAMCDIDLSFEQRGLSHGSWF